jgi:hypothetical protein
MSTNKLFISNLGLNFDSTDRWVNVDICNQLICVDLSASGNYTSFGGHSMLNQKKAWGTTAIGYDVMRNISTRTDISFANTAVGSHAMCGTDISSITGYNNSAFGNCALSTIVNGNNNSAFGYSSLSKNTSGSGNTAFGSNTLSSSITGNNNIAFGHNSLNLNTSGNYNVGIGHCALKTNTLGSYNVACGGSSMNANTSGGNNSSFGHNALLINRTGFNNCAFGFQSLLNNLDTSANTAIGSESLSKNKGSYNVAVGTYALFNDISGSYNTVIGANSDVLQSGVNNNNQIIGYNNKSYFSNVNIIGTNITNNIGSGRTFINNISDSSYSTNNQILVCNPSTNEITYSTNFIRKNVADSSGIFTLSIGDVSQNVNINRDLHMVNDGSLYLTSDKKFALWKYDATHVYIGYKNGGLMSGNSIFTMDNQGNSSTQGSGLFYINNVGGAIMNGLLYMNNYKIFLTSEQNFSIGKIPNDVSNVYFGYGYDGPNSRITVDNTGNVSTSGSGKLFVNNTSGIYVDNLAGPSIAVGVANGVLTRGVTSDPSLKKNVVPLSMNISTIYDKIEKLNPVNFEWIDPKMGLGIQYGFLANEIKELFPNAIASWKDASGNDKLTYDPYQILPVTVSGIKQNNKEISLLKKENAALKEDVTSLHNIIANLSTRLSALETKC